MSFVEFFIIFVIIVIIVCYIHNYVNTEVEYVKSNIDGRLYLVLSLPDKQRAANFLAEINRDLIRLIKHLKAKYPDSEDYDRLYRNYDPDKMSEGTPDSNYTSYTINKSALVICIRQPDTHEFVEKNIVLYPAIHEICHIMTAEIGHTTTFWKNFKEVLTEAINMGVYQKVDFAKNPTPYCGLVLSSHI